MPKPTASQPIKWGFKFDRPDMERIGLFAEMPYMNGKGYVFPFTRQKSSNLRGFVAPGPKILAGTQDALFDQEFRRIFEKEAISRELTPKQRYIGNQPFVSSIGSKLHSTPGDYYGCFSGKLTAFSPVKRPVKPKKSESKVAFLTQPGKKGGPGYIDITIGKYPAYQPSRYGVKPKKKSYGAPLYGPMLTRVRAPSFFGPDPYADPPKVKKGMIYIKPKEKVYGKPLGTGIYIPTGPGKWLGGMKAGCFDNFPEHKPDPYKSAYEIFNPPPESKIFSPQSMENKSFYYTSIVNQNIDFRVNIDNHHKFEPTYLKYLATRSI